MPQMISLAQRGLSRVLISLKVSQPDALFFFFSLMYATGRAEASVMQSILYTSAKALLPVISDSVAARHARSASSRRYCRVDNECRLPAAIRHAPTAATLISLLPPYACAAAYSIFSCRYAPRRRVFSSFSRQSCRFHCSSSSRTCPFYVASQAEQML